MWFTLFVGFGLMHSSKGLHDVAQRRNNIVFDDDDNEGGASVGAVVASIHDDANPSPEEDTTVNTVKYGQYEDETAPEKPAESSIASEMQTAAQVQKQVQVVEQWPSNGGMHVMQVPGSHAPRKVNSLAAVKSQVYRPNLGPLKTQAQLNQEVTEEYDDAEAEGDKYQLPATDEHVGSSDGEPMTYEDLHRKKHGDVDKIILPAKPKVKHDPPEWHPPPPVTQPSQPQIREIPGGPFVPGAFALKDRNLRVAFGTRKNAQARMKDQCMAYVNWLKAAQGPVAPPMGPKILQMMKATCDGAIRAGEANQQYTLMCNSIGSAVEPFLVSPATDWGGICDAVIRVFTESGLGQF
eukprot:gnl/MRDRNA2_/MRDRNA2_102115_c0_seq1.p1 gnl/MRDRNA2_/MRDRNA2_102115_c0~~gnl/MRDRNA2_/MRDRNA2_102115_c0_seq1.p1  ORF type:complete len:351 (+),score=93.94 gnl/MRDRNA2_/MRDRNA2_102115_c0_seq1:123-1175(+)